MPLWLILKCDEFVRDWFYPFVVWGFGTYGFVLLFNSWTPLDLIYSFDGITCWELSSFESSNYENIF